MTVTNTNSSVEYPGDGANKDFETTFRFLEDTDLTVKLTTAAGVTTTKILGTHYNVAGAGADEPGGTVTMVTAPAEDETLTIERNTPVVQGTSFGTFTKFSPETHEEALDKLTMIEQENRRRIEALEAIGDTLGVALGTIAGSKVQLDFMTNVVAVEGTFPINVGVANGQTAEHAWATYLQNLDDPTEVFDEPPAIQWAPGGAPNLFSLKRVSGLKPGTHYRLRFVVLQP